MKLHKIMDLEVPGGVRDAAFWDEETIVVTTPAADVWRLDLGASRRPPQQLHTGQEVLAPVARGLGKEGDLAPAAGGYPRLAVSRTAAAVVVNTHDTVLVACDATDIRRPPRVIAMGWGQYYPALGFSSDGSWFCMSPESPLTVWDTRTWRWRSSSEYEHGVWHATQPLLLCTTDNDPPSLAWLSAAAGGEELSAARVLGPIDVGDDWMRMCGLSLDPSGEYCAAAFENGRLVWWRLEPLEQVAELATSDGELKDIQVSTQGRWLAALRNRAGVELWDLNTRRPLDDTMLDASDVVFSPSATRLIALSNAGNPHPRFPSSGPTSAALWQLAE
jgi:hypothetical protein